MFTSTDGRERAAHLDEAQREALAGADLLDPTGRVRVERIDPDGTAVGTGEALVRRVVAAGVDLARLVAVRLDGTIHSSDVHALERAAIVAALLVTRVEAVTAVENKYRGDFLRDVFLGRAGEDDYVAEHAQAFGWHLDRPVVVVVAVLDPDAIAALAPGPNDRRAWQDRFAHAWRQVAATVDESIASVDFSREVVTLVPGRPRGRGGRRPRRGATGSSRRCAATAAAAGSRSRPVSAGSPTTWASCPRPSGRRSGRSRSAAGCTAAGRSPASTSSACTGCSRSCPTAPS